MAKIDLKKFHVKTIILIIALIIITLFFLGFLKLNFLVGEQLRMTISPEYSEVNVVSPGTLTIDVDVKVYNKFVCEATCNYTLTDVSSNEILDSGSFSTKAFKNEHYTKDILLDEKGYGTRLYLYRIECVNTYSNLCPVSDDSLIRKSLVVASYNPDSVQLSALEYSKSAYNEVLLNYINASKILSGTGEIIGLLNLPVNTSIYHSLDNDLSVLYDDMNDVVNIWDTQDLILTKSAIDSKGIVQKSKKLLDSVKEYNINVVSIAKNHNSLMNDLSKIQNNMFVYSKVLTMPSRLSGIYNSSTNLSLTVILYDYNNLISYVSNEYNYTSANSTYNKINSQISSLDSTIVASVSSSIKSSYVPLYVHSKIICESIPSKCSTYEYAKYTNYSISDIQDAHSSIMELCNISDSILLDTEISNISSTVVSINSSNSSSNLSNTSSNSSLILESFDSLLLQYRLLSEYYSLTQNIDALYYIDDVESKLLDYYNVSDANSYSNLIINESQVNFSSSNLLILKIKEVSSSCNTWKNSNSIIIKNLPSKIYDTGVLDNPSLYDLDVSVRPIPEYVPQCCLYGKCQSCEKSPEKNPLIMLHGHAFIEDAHAYRSIEIFNDFEFKLSEDKLYYSSGILIPNTESTENILGKYYLPVASKPTYYLESYNDLLGLTVSESKTGSIDTYALRLKEYIDYTKYITGSQKVDIVAHSMGGLVVRRYIQIFGGESLGKVILVGTPNQGITERTYTFCKLFGATNECDDMRNGGLFLKKLNDQSNTAVIDELYLVIGRGCDTDGFDGDGVVVANNSIIRTVSKDNILYVEGKCVGTSALHNELLDTEKYPEVYWFVKETLSK